MGIPTSIWIQIAIEIITLAFFGGIMWAKMNTVEKKQDKHNNLVERMILIEYKTKLAEEDIKELEKEHSEVED